MEGIPILGMIRRTFLCKDKKLGLVWRASG